MTYCSSSGMPFDRSALSPTAPSDLQRGLFVLSAFPLAVAGLVRPDRPGASRAIVVLDTALLAGLVLFVYFYVGASFGSHQRGFEAWRQVATLGQTLVVAVTLTPLAMVSSMAWTPTYRYAAAAASTRRTRRASTPPGRYAVETGRRPECL